MKLKVIGKRNFGIGEQVFDNTNWTAFESGLYEVIHCPESKPGDAIAKQVRILMFWGYDENFPENQKILLCMPFPGVAIVAEQERQPITEFISSPAETGISGDVLLKAIAIAQDPKLALELL